MRTTININEDLLNRLKNASTFLGISTHNLIELLVNTVISKNALDISAFKGVRYQDADPEKNWSTHHVTLRPQMYEKDLDLKKCFKFSFSFLVSFAIVHFLDEILEKFKDPEKIIQEMDNYPLNYIFITKNYNGIDGLTVFWGMPEEEYLKELIP